MSKLSRSNHYEPAVRVARYQYVVQCYIVLCVSVCTSVRRSVLHNCVCPCALVIESKQTNIVVQKQQFFRILAQQAAAPVSIQLSCCTKQLLTGHTGRRCRQVLACSGFQKWVLTAVPVRIYVRGHSRQTRLLEVIGQLLFIKRHGVGLTLIVDSV